MENKQNDIFAQEYTTKKCHNSGFTLVFINFYFKQSEN